MVMTDKVDEILLKEIYMLRGDIKDLRKDVSWLKTTAGVIGAFAGLVINVIGNALHIRH